MAFDIERTKSAVSRKLPFFGTVMSNLAYRRDESIPTAATNGSEVIYNTDFLNKLSFEEQQFVFAHEICHVAFKHMFRLDEKDLKVWNIATDAVINALLKKEGLPLIEGGVEIEGAENFTAEQMYKKLMEMGEELKDFLSSLNIENSDSQEKSGQGSHDLWEEAYKDYITQENNDNEKNDQGKNDQGKDGQGKDDQGKDGQGKDGQEKDDQGKDGQGKDGQGKDGQGKDGQGKDGQGKDGQGNDDINEQEAFKKNREMRNQNREKFRRDLAKSSKTSSIRFQDIGTSKTSVDWRRFLYNSVYRDYDWSFKNATVEDGFIVPKLEPIDIPTVEILLDSSRSVSDELLKNFLRECKGILKNATLKIGFFDHEFHGFQKIRNMNDIDNIEIKGRGGTDFDVAVNAFSRGCANKVIFTDGEADMPQKSVRAIWIVFGEEEINPPGGRVIYMDEKDRKKLEETSFVVDDVNYR